MCNRNRRSIVLYSPFSSGITRGLAGGAPELNADREEIFDDWVVPCHEFGSASSQTLHTCSRILIGVGSTARYWNLRASSLCGRRSMLWLVRAIDERFPIARAGA